MLVNQIINVIEAFRKHPTQTTKGENTGEITKSYKIILAIK